MLTSPAGKGLLCVRSILASMVLSQIMLKTVVPLMDENRLTTSIRNNCQLIKGHLELMNPVIPVKSNNVVWRLLISLQWFLKIEKYLIPMITKTYNAFS